MGAKDFRPCENGCRYYDKFDECPESCPVKRLPALMKEVAAHKDLPDPCSHCRHSIPMPGHIEVPAEDEEWQCLLRDGMWGDKECPHFKEWND